MIADRTPMRWPPAWQSPGTLNLLKGTPFNCLLDVTPGIADAARHAGIEVLAKDAVPDGVTILEGVWPGIKMARFGASNAVTAGPTGDPWVNSNIWPVRLAQARNPGATVWVGQSAIPVGLASVSYATAIADAALTGGRWILSLDPALATAMLEGKPGALASWNRIVSAAGFFAAHRVWSDYRPEALVGIVSAFATSAEQEVLNLIARSGQQYRVIVLENFTPSSLDRLRAVILPDKDEPLPSVREALTRFIDAGGLLIAGKTWEPTPRMIAKRETHPRFNLFTLGNGTLAIAKGDLNDPYILASDAAILVSHRHDLLRFWNGGALSAYYSAAPDRKRAVVQILFYADRPTEDASLRIAGNYRSAMLSTFENPDPRPVHAEINEEAIEIHLPRVDTYAAVELE